MSNERWVMKGSNTNVCNVIILAPEMVNMEGYNKPVDMWAVGVITYILYAIMQTNNLTSTYLIITIITLQHCQHDA